MAKKHAFHAHADAAKKAHTAGDHAKAAKHIGHMFAANRAAQRGATPMTPMPTEPDDDEYVVNQGQPSDRSAPPQQMTPAKPAFNASRFGAIKAKK